MSILCHCEIKRFRQIPLMARLRMLACIVVLCLAVLPKAIATERSTRVAEKRPNILFCLADDWGWPHAGVYGDKVVRVPAFERIAREGVSFTHAFSAAPSCTPSRASILTGQAPHRLGEGASLYGPLDKSFPVYPDLLEKSGYAVGYLGKGWGPGDFRAGGRSRNPAGPAYKSFAEFLKSVSSDQPFCFWFGSHDPHRPYPRGSGARAGLKPEDAQVPPYLPDRPEVRSDILDYYGRVETFDHDVAALLRELDKSGRTGNTVVVISGDNGWPFPRGKANLYDAGTRQPLAIRWPGRIKGGRSLDDFVSLTDLAPTFLEAAGLKPLPEMTGQSLLPLLEGKKQSGRDAIFVERERHANVRRGNLSYPSRAIETKEFLYIRNFRPDRWPAGDPEKWKSVGPFGDCDAGPSKEFILSHRDEGSFVNFYEKAFAKRPEEELYDLRKDPSELTNVAAAAEYQTRINSLRQALRHWMESTADPILAHTDEPWDNYQYGGPMQ
jgi:N-sulfoglucosamine sulfohydrolase